MSDPDPSRAARYRLEMLEPRLLLSGTLLPLLVLDPLETLDPTVPPEVRDFETEAEPTSAAPAIDWGEQEEAAEGAVREASSRTVAASRTEPASEPNAILRGEELLPASRLYDPSSPRGPPSSDDPQNLLSDDSPASPEVEGNSELTFA